MRYTYLLSFFLTGCTVLYPHTYTECPAYATNVVPQYTYDPNTVECSTWYEWYDSYFWYTYDKGDALELWAEISKRPMYFEGLGIFRYSVRADDGNKYYFWNIPDYRWVECDVPDTLYNITVDVRTKRMPL